jgi:hypothetical protein
MQLKKYTRQTAKMSAANMVIYHISHPCQAFTISPATFRNISQNLWGIGHLTRKIANYHFHVDKPDNGSIKTTYYRITSLARKSFTISPASYCPTNQGNDHIYGFTLS